MIRYKNAIAVFIAGIICFVDAKAATWGFEPAILGAAGASNTAVVFPIAGANPPPQQIVSGMPGGAVPHGVAYYGLDNALVADFGNRRVLVVKVSTASVIDTISMLVLGYDYEGFGTIAVTPAADAALAMGDRTGTSNGTLYVIHAPFNSSSTVSALLVPGIMKTWQTQGIVFNSAGRAFVYTTSGISVLDPPYTSIAFTIAVGDNANGGAIAISPDGNRLLTTNLADNAVRIFSAPYSASSVPQLLTITAANRIRWNNKARSFHNPRYDLMTPQFPLVMRPDSISLDGIMVTPDGQTAIVVSAYTPQAFSITAPFVSGSNVAALPVPGSGGESGFEDVGISADGQLAILTGNDFSHPPVFVRAPFTAGAQAYEVPLTSAGNPNRGAGAVRFRSAPPPTPTPTPTPTPCNYSVSPTNQNFIGSGGDGSFDVSSTIGCAWAPVSNDGWIHITSYITQTGGGTVNYHVAANSGPARSGTITVESETFTVTQDEGSPTPTPTPTPVPCAVVTNTSAVGAGSLNDAITCANNHPGLDTITFNIPSNDPGCHDVAGVGRVCTIQPAGGLTSITDPVTIDGYTQPGASPNTLAVGDDAKILVEIDGTNAPQGSGFWVRVGSVTIRGLVINRFSSQSIITDRGHGVYLEGPGSVVEGCFIGTDPTGTIALPNGKDAVSIHGPGSQAIRVGGSDPAQRNILSGNAGNGVLVVQQAGDVHVLGNYIGTDRNGTAAVPNAGGVYTDRNGSPNRNRIGGPTAGERNIISGNFWPDLNAGYGVYLNGGDGDDIVQGNYIGIGADGITAVGNSGHGVTIGFRNNTPGFLIGGPNPGEGNVISANGGNGIYLGFSGYNTMQGNLIGTAADGQTPRGNSLNGILMSSANVNAIGGTAAGAGNVIAFNGRKGVVLNGGSGGTQSVIGSILGNLIHDNNSLGIDLSDDGVNPNDHCDADHCLNGCGANGNQNYPVLTSATVSNGSTVVVGSLDSVSDTAYRIEFFSSPACDASGYGEGRTFLGATNLTTDANCSTAINIALGAVPAGQFISATATDAVGNTSEFSACVPVQAAVTIMPTSAVSRKMHGTFAGDIDLLPPAAGIECRRGTPSGKDFTVVVTFANPVTVGGATVLSEDSVATTDAPSVSGAVVTVQLHNVSDTQSLTITLVDVSDGTTTGNVSIPMHVLLGDTTGNGTVNASDVSQTKSQSGQVATASNFRTDVTVTGVINASDVSLVKSKSGNGLP